MTDLSREYFKGLQSFDTEEDYRNSPSINYSTLKEIPNGPQCLVEERTFRTNKVFEVGNYVDKYFTSRDALGEEFELAKLKIELNPSLEILFQAFVDSEIYEPTIDECVTMVRANKIWDSIKDDEKIKLRITGDFFTKLKEMSENSGKIKMTAEQHSQAIVAINNILINDYAINLITEQEGEIIIPQFMTEFDLPADNKGGILRCKAMFDFLKFDTINHRIKGIDLKTGAIAPHEFGNQFLKYRYDIQGILYYCGMMALRKKHFPDWSVCVPQDFCFLYTQKRSNIAPIIVQLTEKFIQKCSEFINFNGNILPGISTLLEDVYWYMEHQCFDRHRLVAENNGTVLIDKLL